MRPKLITSCRLFFVAAVALVLLASSVLPVSADDGHDGEDGYLEGAPPGAIDGEPVGNWDDPPVPQAESSAGLASDGTASRAASQRWFGREPFEKIQSAATVAAHARPTCPLSPIGLTALALAPIFQESSTGASKGQEPSPLTLSRYDVWKGEYPPPDNNTTTRYGLLAFRDPNTKYPRAYWHPGIGVWQYDSAGVGAPFTAAERVDVGIVAADVTQEMASRYCNAGGTDQNRRNAAWRPWGASCYSDCQRVFEELYPNFGTLKLSNEVSATGGMEKRTCKLVGTPGTFTCHRIDPEKAQGANWWTANPDGTPTRLAPLSSAFYVFQRNGYEERHWLRADTEYDIDVSAKRRMGRNARPRSNQADSGLTWSSSSALCDTALSRNGCTVDAPLVRSSIETLGSAKPFVGDFNGDGRGDLFWYTPGGGRSERWISRGDDTFTKRALTIQGVYQPFVGDFDGNGRDDIFWYAPGPAPDHIWWNGDPAESVRHDVGGRYEPLVGDFEGNGRDDIMWYAAGPAPDYVWTWSGDRRYSSRTQNVSGHYEPLIGDFDGNGREDIFWYGPGAVADSVWYGRPGGFSVLGVSVNGTYSPLVGDFDGDGRDDILWYQPGSPPDFTWFGLAGRGFTSKRNDIFGTYRPFVVDLDLPSDSGGDDIVFYGPGAATDVLWKGRADRAFGVSVDIDIGGDYVPLVADFARTAREDIVFWDPAGGGNLLWSS